MDDIYRNKQIDIDNQAKRIPVCMVIDASQSMTIKNNEKISRIKRVNEGIKLFYEQTSKDSATKNSVEICILSVANETKVVSDFSQKSVPPEEIKAVQECGDLIKGVKKAIEELDGRKILYKENGIDYYQPWLIIMSDGKPTRQKTKPELVLEELTEYQNSVIKDRAAKGVLTIFPVWISDSIGSASSAKARECMINFLPESKDGSKNDNRLITLDANSKTFSDLFEFLHQSASSLSSGLGLIDDNYGYKGGTKYSSTNIDNSEISENKNFKTIAVSQENIDKQTNEEYKRIQLLREESNKYTLPKNNGTKKKEIHNNFIMCVNGERVYPIKSKSDLQTELTIYLNKGNKVKLYKDDNAVPLGRDDEFLVVEDGKYNFLISSSNDVAIKKATNESCNSHNVAEINAEINQILKQINDWDKI